MTTPSEAIEAQRKVRDRYHSKDYEHVITPEELARLYAIKDAFEKVMDLLAKDMVCEKCRGYSIPEWKSVGVSHTGIEICDSCYGTGKRNA